MKSIRLYFPDGGVEAIATLLEDQAPKTCEILWGTLPLRIKAIHDIWSGRQIFAPLGSPLEIPPENLSLYVVPGDLYYYERPAHLDRGRPYGWLELAEVGVVYGRDSQPWSPRGPKVVNIFATIAQGLPSFAERCAQMITEGGRWLEITRA